MAYAIKISSLGFYWDDWQSIFNSRFAHLVDYWNYWLNNRPAGSWVWMLTVPLRRLMGYSLSCARPGIA